MKNDSLVIYVDTNTKIRIKEVHYVLRNTCRRRKLKRKKIRDSFCVTYGDLPVGCINNETGKLENVINNRGLGYSHRNALRYRKTKKEVFNSEV